MVLSLEKKGREGLKKTLQEVVKEESHGASVRQVECECDIKEGLCKGQVCFSLSLKVAKESFVYRNVTQSYVKANTANRQGTKNNNQEELSTILAHRALTSEQNDL
ncbi:hypothetical protein CR513_54174, partial [Mucuna pruriens]